MTVAGRARRADRVCRVGAGAGVGGAVFLRPDDVEGDILAQSGGGDDAVADRGHGYGGREGPGQRVGHRQGGVVGEQQRGDRRAGDDEGDPEVDADGEVDSTGVDRRPLCPDQQQLFRLGEEHERRGPQVSVVAGAGVGVIDSSCGQDMSKAIPAPPPEVRSPWRTGCEGRISALKRGDGLDRTPGLARCSPGLGRTRDPDPQAGQDRRADRLNPLHEGHER